MQTVVLTFVVVMEHNLAALLFSRVRQCMFLAVHIKLQKSITNTSVILQVPTLFLLLTVLLQFMNWDICFEQKNLHAPYKYSTFSQFVHYITAFFCRNDGISYILQSILSTLNILNDILYSLQYTA